MRTAYRYPATLDLTDLLGMKDWHQAARLIDPKRPSKLRRLAAARDALGRKIEIVVVSQGPAIAEFPPLRQPKPESTDPGTVRLGGGCIMAEFPPLRGRPRVSRPTQITSPTYGCGSAAARFLRLRECH